NYVGSAVETIEGVRLIKERFPECKTILGISNVSFGLPPAGREVLNAVFLYDCTKAGLDYAIVNTERLERYPSIPEEERRLAEDLIFQRGADPVAAFAAHFRGRTKAAPARSTLSLDERLARYIVEGSRDGLVDDLEEKRRDTAPLDIINGPLMKGLVEIILANNGYRVINLGIKVPPETLIAACHEHKPDAIGLSGLLVKSAQQMVVTAQDFRAAGVDIPLFVGGAALTRKFTATRIAPEHAGLTVYAKDAMDGLDLANRLFAATTREALIERVRA